MTFHLFFTSQPPIPRARGVITWCDCMAWNKKWKEPQSKVNLLKSCGGLFLSTRKHQLVLLVIIILCPCPCLPLSLIYFHIQNLHQYLSCTQLKFEIIPKRIPDRKNWQNLIYSKTFLCSFNLKLAFRVRNPFRSFYKTDPEISACFCQLDSYCSWIFKTLSSI